MKSELLLPVIGLLLLASCGKDPGSDNKKEQEEQPAAPVTLQLSSEIATRTVLGDKVGAVYQVYWTDGDRICVNGVKSSALIGVEEKAVKGDFTVSGVKAPYHVVYPSIRCTSMTEEGIASVKLPSVQAWTPGSFASGSAMLYGSSESEGFALRNLCGVVRIPLCKGSEFGGLISSVVLSSAAPSAPICGSFNLDTRDGSLEAADGSISLQLSLPPEGITLSETDSVFFHLCIPAGEYPEGFHIQLSCSEGTMLCDWVAETEVPAGIMVTLPKIAFKPKSTKLIDSIESWNEFAAAVNAGDYSRWVDEDTGEASIVSDISYGGDLTAIEALPAGVTLNGNGHSIKRAAATDALIFLVSEGAAVKNLVVGGKRVDRGPGTAGIDRGTGNLASFNRGLVENCINEMNTEISGLDGNIIIAGLVTDNAGTIRDCKNTGNISISLNITANRTIYGGGICARGFRPLDNVQYCGDIINCENTGSIVVYKNSSGNYSLTKVGIGGILGVVDYGVPDGEFCTIKDCKNSGSITVWQDSKHTTTNYSYSVGGILGRCCVYSNGPDFYYLVGGANATSHAGYYVVIENCENTGSIDVSLAAQTYKPTDSGARQVYVGGIAGCLQSSWDAPAVVKGCRNVSSIRGGYSAADDIVGGIIGGGGYLTMENCYSDVAFGQSKTTLSSPQYMGAYGAVLGVALRDMEIKDCEGIISYDRGTTAGRRGAGFVACAAKHNNIKEHVATTGYSSLTLSGTNWFSGTIDGVPVTLEDVTIHHPTNAEYQNQGKVYGTITLR